MSWQATSWAAKQKTGSPACKLILLALANYADASGAAWPSQDTLAADTEQSVDSVQRRIKQLVNLGLIRIDTLPAKRGQWAGRIYFLNMPVAEMSEPQSAARSRSMASGVTDGGAGTPAPLPERNEPKADRAATETVTVPQPERSPCRKALRHKPSIEQSIEPSLNSISTTEPRANAAAALGERLRDFRGKQEGSEVVQNRIAQRIGHDGWLVLGNMSDDQRALLTTLERRGELDHTTLANAAARARCAPEQPTPGGAVLADPIPADAAARARCASEQPTPGGEVLADPIPADAAARASRAPGQPTPGGGGALGPS